MSADQCDSCASANEVEDDAEECVDVQALRSVACGDVLLGKYRVEHVLGTGGMSVVLGVRHVEAGEFFAMKLPRLNGFTGDERVVVRRRFLREACAVARLRGEHVARVFEVGELDDGHPYMLLEHLEGTDLEAMLQEEGPLSPREVIAYVLEALDALREAHSLGIIHRDLKPANLFLARRPDGTSSIKLLDFGISKDEARVSLRITRDGVILGTPYYMSPEQMRSANDVDARSDIWSLGVVMYELLTDTVPFPGLSATEICAKVLEGQPPPMSFDGSLPLQLVEAVNRCLAWHPADRYQSVDELANALSGALDEISEPASARCANAEAEVTGRGAQRRPRLSLADTDQQEPPIAMPATNATRRSAGRTYWAIAAGFAMCLPVVIGAIVRTPSAARARGPSGGQPSLVQLVSAAPAPAGSLPPVVAALGSARCAAARVTMPSVLPSRTPGPRGSSQPSARHRERTPERRDPGIN